MAYAFSQNTGTLPLHVVNLLGLTNTHLFNTAYIHTYPMSISNNSSFHLCGRIQLLKTSTMQTHIPKYPRLLLDQRQRGIKLCNFALVQDNQTIIVDNRTQPMGN